MSDQQTAPAVPVAPLLAERAYARAIGWLYLALGTAGLFTDTLWHMFSLTGTMTVIHFCIGISGLTIARQGQARSHRIFAITAGLSLSAWGLTGTLAPQFLQPYPLPLENALHLITGIWGFYGVLNSFWNRSKG